jgi:hypothetical protein
MLPERTVRRPDQAEPNLESTGVRCAGTIVVTVPDIGPSEVLRISEHQDAVDRLPAHRFVRCAARKRHRADDGVAPARDADKHHRTRRYRRRPCRIAAVERGLLALGLRRRHRIEAIDFGPARSMECSLIKLLPEFLAGNELIVCNPNFHQAVHLANGVQSLQVWIRRE